ncbi:MAG: hypothetical protein OER87_08550 [Gammaproteobacteria bacterium]|nr:hypothetical protein [Gammaproteobacteria bacterium]
MKQERLRPWLTRFAHSVIDRLLRHVTWHASESRNLSRQPGEHFPLVIILGREHYSERRKSYPALRRRDLEKVLREDLAGEPPTLAVFGPISGERREVSFYRMKRAVVEALPRSLFIVPESVLLGVGLAAENWADVERQQYRYFLFRDGPSQPAGGALGQRDLVALAAGIDPDCIPEEYRGSDDLLLRMRRSLPALPASTWWSCRNPLPRGFGLERVAWKPLAVTAGLMLFAYLALSSIYLQSVLAYRTGVLEELEPGIQEGLIADNEARAYEARGAALIELWSGRSDTQQVWEAVALALQNRATVSQLDMQSGRVSFYGEAPDASEILTLLGSTPGFVDVSFDAPVRSGRNGRQSFALSFVLSNVRSGTANTAANNQDNNE